jgi:CTP synthase (UTP-ammonia lyase)
LVRVEQVTQLGLIQYLAPSLLTEAAKAALLLEQVQTVVLVAGVERLPQAVQEIHHQPLQAKVTMVGQVQDHRDSQEAVVEAQVRQVKQHHLMPVVTGVMERHLLLAVHL